MKRLLCALLVCVLAAGARGEVPPEAQAWASACQKSPPPLYQQAVGKMIERMKTEGLWEKCGLLLFFAAHEATPAAFNLKGCPNGVMVGGVEHQPGRALKGNGVDAWYDTKVHGQDIP